MHPPYLFALNKESAILDRHESISTNTMYRMSISGVNSVAPLVMK